MYKNKGVRFFFFGGGVQFCFGGWGGGWQSSKHSLTNPPPPDLMALCAKTKTGPASGQKTLYVKQTGTKSEL